MEPSPQPSSSRLAIAATLVVMAFIAARASASECARLRADLRPAAATSIGVHADPGFPLPALERAASAWSACGDYGFQLPRLLIAHNGTRDLFVRFDPTAVGEGERCGAFRGRVITLFAHTRLDSGRVVPCGSLAQNLVHELGHALGLADAPRSCGSFAMSKLHPGNGFHRRVRPAECRLLQGRWRTLPEPSPRETLESNRIAHNAW